MAWWIIILLIKLPKYNILKDKYNIYYSKYFFIKTFFISVYIYTALGSAGSLPPGPLYFFNNFA